MTLDHEAIYKAYPNVKRVDDDDGAQSHPLPPQEQGPGGFFDDVEDKGS